MTAGSVVFDASAVIRAAVDDDPAAREALDRATVRLAPDLVYAEVTSALVQYARAGMLTELEAAAVLRDVLSVPLETTPVSVLAPAVLSVALDLDLSAYDACYVALARAADAPLVTADRRLAAAYDRSELVS